MLQLKDSQGCTEDTHEMYFNGIPHTEGTLGTVSFPKERSSSLRASAALEAQLSRRADGNRKFDMGAAQRVHWHCSNYYVGFKAAAQITETLYPSTSTNSSRLHHTIRIYYRWGFYSSQNHPDCDAPSPFALARATEAVRVHAVACQVLGIPETVSSHFR
jgi:hypothetical protein